MATAVTGQWWHTATQNVDWANSYQQAIDTKYRFYSYGDCMLIL